MGLHGNFFRPVMKLRRKAWHGVRVHDALTRTYRTLNPVPLIAKSDHALDALWTIADRRQEPDPSGTLSSDATRKDANA